LAGQVGGDGGCLRPPGGGRLIRDIGVTTTFVAPAMLQMMLAEPTADKAAFASLRKVVYGGSPIGVRLLTECLELIGADFVQAYAATETGNAVALLPPADHQVGNPLLAAAGLPCPGVALRIVDRAGNVLPTGEVGEVQVRTPAVMLGYWRQQEATRNALVDGWLSMGDAGYLDDNGYLFLRDRIKDTIIVAGQNVAPGGRRGSGNRCATHQLGRGGPCLRGTPPGCTALPGRPQPPGRGRRSNCPEATSGADCAVFGRHSQFTWRYVVRAAAIFLVPAPQVDTKGVVSCRIGFGPW